MASNPRSFSISNTPITLREFRNPAEVFHHVRLAVEIPAAKQSEHRRLDERPPDNRPKDVAGSSARERRDRHRGPMEQHNVPRPGPSEPGRESEGWGVT